jgi:hypothetical protein
LRKNKKKKGHTGVVMEGSRATTTTSYPSSQELEKNSPYVDCNFNWTNIDLSPDPGDQHQQQHHGNVYQEVVDISQSDIYQFAVSGTISTVASTAEINN